MSALDIVLAAGLGIVAGFVLVAICAVLGAVAGGRDEPAPPS